MLSKNKFFFLLIFLFLFNFNVHAQNKAPIDITTKNIEELNYYLNLGVITSEELINLFIDRINEYDKNYNSIITINENAIEEAKKLDLERSKNKERSILHGIPIIVKDNIDVFGMPTTAGARALSDNYPKKNSVIIQDLIDAGAIILAKSNMSEFAFSADVSNSSYGNVRNAYDTNYSPYGSSGGSAVAVAAAFAPIALGTDTNSSARLPAAANNVIGLRPTTKTLSNVGIIAYDIERDTAGILTKNIPDLEIVYNILIKKNRELSNKTNLEGITIGIPRDFMEGNDDNLLKQNKRTYSEIIKLMKSAIENLENKEAKIVYLDTYYTNKTNEYFNNSMSGYLMCDEFNKYIKNTTSRIRSFDELNMNENKTTDLEINAYYCNTSRTLDEKNELKNDYKQYITKIMKENNLDVIAYPSSKNKLAKYNDHVSLNNLTSHAAPTINFPAISVRLGLDKEGLPYGIEFMGKPNEEALLFEISNVYEKNYINFELPKISPNLYQVDDEVKELVNNYEQIFNKKIKFKKDKEWLKITRSYFRNYSENENVKEDAKTLNTYFKEAVKQRILYLIITPFILYSLFCTLKIIKKKSK